MILCYVITILRLYPSRITMTRDSVVHMCAPRAPSPPGLTTLTELGTGDERRACERVFGSAAHGGRRNTRRPDLGLQQFIGTLEKNPRVIDFANCRAQPNSRRGLDDCQSQLLLPGSFKVKLVFLISSEGWSPLRQGTLYSAL